MTIISGYADRLESVVPPGEQGSLDTIQTHADTIATLVQNVRTLSVFALASQSIATIDSDYVIDSALSEMRSQPSIDIDTPDGSPPAIQASPMISEAMVMLCDAIDSLIDTRGELTIDYE